MRFAPLACGHDARVEHGPQLTNRVEQPGARGPDRDSEDPRDLRQRVSVVVMEDDDGALFRSQPREGILELGSVHDGVGRIRSGFGSDRVNAEASVPAAGATRFHVAGVNDESMEPGLEPLGIAQRRQIPPGAEQRLLSRVLRPVAITEDPVGEGEAAIDVLRRE